MRNEQNNPPMACPECGAARSSSAARCWMCQAPFAGDELIPLAEAVDLTPRHSLQESFFQFATLATLALVVLVGVGMAIHEPGSVIIYLMLVGPPLIGATLHVAHRERRDGKVSWASRFTALIASAVIMASALVAIAVALFVAFFVFCLVAMGTGNF